MVLYVRLRALEGQAGVGLGEDEGLVLRCSAEARVMACRERVRAMLLYGVGDGGLGACVRAYDLEDGEGDPAGYARIAKLGDALLTEFELPSFSVSVQNLACSYLEERGATTVGEAIWTWCPVFCEPGPDERRGCCDLTEERLVCGCVLEPSRLAFCPLKEGDERLCVWFCRRASSWRGPWERTLGRTLWLVCMLARVQSWINDGAGLEDLQQFVRECISRILAIERS